MSPTEELMKAAINVANAAAFLRQSNIRVCDELAAKADALAQEIADTHSALSGNH